LLLARSLVKNTLNFTMKKLKLGLANLGGSEVLTRSKLKMVMGGSGDDGDGGDGEVNCDNYTCKGKNNTGCPKGCKCHTDEEARRCYK